APGRGGPGRPRGSGTGRTGGRGPVRSDSVAPRPGWGANNDVPVLPPGGRRPPPRQWENPSPGDRLRPTGVGGWIAPRRLDRRSGFEALASDLGLEGCADRLIEPCRLAGGLLLSFLLDERIPLLRQLEDLLANLPALLDLLRDDFLTIIGRKPLELVGQIVRLHGVEFDSSALDALDQVVV